MQCPFTFPVSPHVSNTYLSSAAPMAPLPWPRSHGPAPLALTCPHLPSTSPIPPQGSSPPRGPFRKMEPWVYMPTCKLLMHAPRRVNHMGLFLSRLFFARHFTSLVHFLLSPLHSLSRGNCSTWPIFANFFVQPMPVWNRLAWNTPP